MTEVESVRLGRCNAEDIRDTSQACRHPIRMAESVRPERCNMLEIWDNMMRTFEDEEAQEDNRDHRAEGDAGDDKRIESEADEGGEKDGAISEGEDEEGIKVTIGKAERAPSKDEVAMHMVNHIPYRSWYRHCVKGKAHSNQHRRKKWSLRFRHLDA